MPSYDELEWLRQERQDKPKANKSTSAPPPITPIRGGSTLAHRQKAVQDMNMAEYRQFRGKKR